MSRLKNSSKHDTSRLSLIYMYVHVHAVCSSQGSVVGCGFGER